MITTYESNCMKCLSGAIHPFHDSGNPAEVLTGDEQFSQLPPENDPLRYVTNAEHSKCRCSCHDNCGR